MPEEQNDVQKKSRRISRSKTVVSAKNLKKAKSIAIMGMLLAIGVVLKTYVNFSLPFMKIETVFIPIAVAGMVLGPVPAVIVGAASDVLGTLIRGEGYFPGFTLSLALMGYIYGVFLYAIKEYPDAKEKTCPKIFGKPGAALYDSLGLRDKRTRVAFHRVVLSDLIVTVLVSCVINTLWLKFIMGDGFASINLVLRIVKSVVACPVHIAVLFALYKVLNRKKPPKKQRGGNKDTAVE